MRTQRTRKHTYGVSLNPVNPIDRDLIVRLEMAPNYSDLIRMALRQYFDGPPIPTINESEFNAIIAELAWYKQQVSPVVVSVGEQVAAAAEPAKPGRELSQAFLAAVRKVAKPGIRLEN